MSIGFPRLTAPASRLWTSGVRNPPPDRGLRRRKKSGTIVLTRKGKKMLTEKEIEAIKVVIGALNDSWYRDVLQSLLDRSKGA